MPVHLSHKGQRPEAIQQTYPKNRCERAKTFKFCYSINSFCFCLSKNSLTHPPFWTHHFWIISIGANLKVKILKKNGSSVFQFWAKSPCLFFKMLICISSSNSSLVTYTVVSKLRYSLRSAKKLVEITFWSGIKSPAAGRMLDFFLPKIALLVDHFYFNW